MPRSPEFALLLGVCASRNVEEAWAHADDVVEFVLSVLEHAPDAALECAGTACGPLGPLLIQMIRADPKSGFRLLARPEMKRARGEVGSVEDVVKWLWGCRASVWPLNWALVVRRMVGEGWVEDVLGMDLGACVSDAVSDGDELTLRLLCEIMERVCEDRRSAERICQLVNFGMLLAMMGDVSYAAWEAIRALWERVQVFDDEGVG